MASDSAVAVEDRRGPAPEVKPVILAVDDEPGVARALQRDLRTAFGNAYRIVRAESGEQALDALRQLSTRAAYVALLVADQRMPRMNGVEFLEQARALFPDAKRVLLTAYADTDAAINAINVADVDKYLTKPWDPPEENLYPVLRSLLDAWQSDFVPPYRGMRLVGDRWSPETYALRDFLERNLVDYRWLDVETTEGASALANTSADSSQLPLLLLPDQPPMRAPSRQELAEVAGLQTRVEAEVYDLVIVGAGPAGLAAAVYGASEGLRTVLVEGQGLGGQAFASSAIENYLGFPNGLTGRELTEKAVQQTTKFGAQVLTAQVLSLRREGDYRVLALDSGTDLTCHSLLLTTGLEWRRLDAPGVEELTGAGVYYGASNMQVQECSDQQVYVVGGGNSAGQAAVAFARNGARVKILIRGDDLGKSMSQYLVDRIRNMSQIEVRTCTQVIAAYGDSHLAELDLADDKTGQTTREPADRLFLFIGAVPQTSWLNEAVRLDERGFILTGPDLVTDGKRPPEWPEERNPFLLETNVPGVFAAGDVRHDSTKRVASGVGEGAMAVQLVHRYLGGRVR